MKKEIFKIYPEPMEEDKYLEPCPFCGSKATMVIGFSFYGEVYSVECSNKECKAIQTHSDSTQEAVIRWNRRK